MRQLNELVDNPAWKKVWFAYCNGNNGRLAGYYGKFAPDLTAERRNDLMTPRRAKLRST